MLLLTSQKPTTRPSLPVSYPSAPSLHLTSLPWTTASSSSLSLMLLLRQPYTSHCLEGQFQSTQLTLSVTRLSTTATLQTSRCCQQYRYGKVCYISRWSNLIITVANHVRFLRKYYATPSIQTLVPVETFPHVNITSDTDIENILHTVLMYPSFTHPSCICAILPLDKGDIISPDLRVYGTSLLSVVDASVIPLIPTTHL